MKTNK